MRFPASLGVALSAEAAALALAITPAGATSRTHIGTPRTECVPLATSSLLPHRPLGICGNLVSTFVHHCAKVSTAGALGFDAELALEAALAAGLAVWLLASAGGKIALLKNSALIRLFVMPKLARTMVGKCVRSKSFAVCRARQMTLPVPLPEFIVRLILMQLHLSNPDL